MNDVIGEARQRQSAALFNNTYYADVVLQIAALSRKPHHFVTTRKIAAAAGLADSLVRPVVLRLEAAELLGRLPRLGGRRGEQHFMCSTSAAWINLVRLCRSLKETGFEAADVTAVDRTPSAVRQPKRGGDRSDDGR